MSFGVIHKKELKRFSKSLLRVMLYVLLQEIKNISLLNEPKANVISPNEFLTFFICQ